MVVNENKVLELGYHNITSIKYSCVQSHEWCFQISAWRALVSSTSWSSLYISSRIVSSRIKETCKFNYYISMSLYVVLLPTNIDWYSLLRFSTDTNIFWTYIGSDISNRLLNFVDMNSDFRNFMPYSCFKYHVSI